MTALVASATIYRERTRKTFRFPAAAAVTIYKGARCALIGGYLYPVDERIGLAHPCLSIEQSGTVDNGTGAAGDLYCDVEFARVKELSVYRNDGTSPVTATQIGGSCYFVDDSGIVSASNDGNTRSRAGTPWLIVASDDAMGQRAAVYVEHDADSGVAQSLLVDALAQGHIDLTLKDFYLLTGAPLAIFAGGASTVPGSALVDSKAAAVRWNNDAAPGAVMVSFIVPPDMDITFNATLTIRASKVGATLGDAVTFAVGAFNQVVGALHDADADYGGTTSAMTGNTATKTIQAVTLTLALANLAASPASVTLTINPTAGTLGTDDLVMHSVRITYQKKLLTA
jgi:hypothetical protein